VWVLGVEDWVWLGWMVLVVINQVRVMGWVVRLLGVDAGVLAGVLVVINQVRMMGWVVRLLGVGAGVLAEVLVSEVLRVVWYREVGL
jgi:hypothetical protein